MINWQTYTDNDLILYDNRPCIERFTTPADKYAKIKLQYVPENEHVKQILKTKLSNINITQHCSSGEILNNTTYNNVGEKINELSPFQKINWDISYIKHFPTKTLDEFINNKFIKGTCDGNPEFPNYPLEWFFKYNKITEEKINYLKEHNIDTTHINKQYISSWWPY